MKLLKSLLLILFCLTAAIGSAFADTDPLPSDSIGNALFFGDIRDPLPVDLTPPPAWEAGMRRDFNVLNIPKGEIISCSARILLVTENIVFWCDEQTWDLIPADLEDTLLKFDGDVLPMLRETFGHESSPGVDYDPRFHVLFTNLIGQGYNGYFSAADSADTRLNPSSNGMELVFLSTNLFAQGGNAILDTLSHEVQHMIHFASDPNETSFINEGFSGLAQDLAVRGPAAAFIRQYLNNTGRSLIWWPEQDTGAWYGSSFLFSRYLYDRFGSEFIRTLVSQPEDGLNGLDRALLQEGIPYSADEVFSQWSAALLGQLLRTPVRDWDYTSYRFPQDGIYRDIRTLSCGTPELHEISQYGILFYRPDCGGPYRFSITGAAESPVTSLSVPGGESAWWSGAVSNSLSYLRREFDLREVSAPVSFEYDIDFHIENGYDYYYLLLEDQDGKTVRLTPSTATDVNLTGENRGSGTTGISGRVLHEVIDLSPWAGQQIRLTFVYLTDTAGLNDGLLADNFRIDAIGFLDDTESPENGWEARGFRRVRRAIPQLFTLTVLHLSDDGTSSTDFYTFKGGEEMSAECPDGSCAFAVSAANREIRARTSFTIAAVTP